MRFLRYLCISVSLLGASCFAFPAFASDANTIDKIIVFGDSLSDNGNLYHTSLGIIPKSPPYYQGRFTNGPAWSDLMAEAMSKNHNIATDNYAVGGETVNFHNPLKGFMPYTFKDSLNSYYFHYFLRDKSHTLFVVWLGANDYLHGVEDSDISTDDKAKEAARKTALRVTTTIQTNIEGLIASGGKNFLLINLPDLAVVPFAKPVTPMERVALHYLSTENNAQLKELASTLQHTHPDIVIRVFDFETVFNDLLNHLDDFNQRYHTHIKNLTDSCWTGGYFRRLAMTAQVDEIRRTLEADYNRKQTTLNVTLPAKSDVDFTALAQYVAQSPDLMATYEVTQNATRGGSACAQPDDYAFWDTVHPTAVAHMIIGQYLTNAVEEFLTRK